MFTSSKDIYADPTKAFLILKLLSATKSRSRPDIRLPITLPVLHLLVDALRQTSSSFYHRTLFTAMFLTAFYGFLRVGEITCQTTSSGRSVLQHQDLSFLLRQGEVIAAKLTLTNFKHNRSGVHFISTFSDNQALLIVPLGRYKVFVPSVALDQDRYSP